MRVRQQIPNRDASFPRPASLVVESVPSGSNHQYRKAPCPPRFPHPRSPLARIIHTLSAFIDPPPSLPPRSPPTSPTSPPPSLTPDPATPAPVLYHPPSSLPPFFTFPVSSPVVFLGAPRARFGYRPLKSWRREEEEETQEGRKSVLLGERGSEAQTSVGRCLLAHALPASLQCIHIRRQVETGLHMRLARPQIQPGSGNASCGERGVWTTRSMHGDAGDDRGHGPVDPYRAHLTSEH